jgi:hypothetical protein
MSSIAAGTTTGSALVSTGDTTGELVFKTNGTTTALTIDTSQNVVFESTGSITIPVGTTAERPSSPTNGMIRYNTTINSTEWYDGFAGVWKQFNGTPGVEVEYLVVAGGGGGGSGGAQAGGGGGGAGGFRTGSVIASAGSSLSVTIGGGGTEAGIEGGGGGGVGALKETVLASPFLP